VDVQVILLLLKTSEEYTIAKIVARINRGNMPEDYHKLQREGSSNLEVLSMNDLVGVFHKYLNHLYNDSRNVAGGLFHIITRFTRMYK
jgi:hypothetical protein